MRKIYKLVSIALRNISQLAGRFGHKRYILLILVGLSACVETQQIQQGGNGGSAGNTTGSDGGGGSANQNMPQQAMSQPMTDHIYDQSIHTITFSKAGLPGSYPVLQLNEIAQLSLQFDKLGAGNATNYQYTIVHCNADWKPSNMLKTDFIQGLFQDMVNGFSFSTNTYRKYVHYNLLFPTDNMKPKISGNYILKVYEYDQNRPVLTRRFYVIDQQADISGRVGRASYAKYRNTHQELNFEINLRQLYVLDPYTNIKVVMKQNWRNDNEIHNLPPTYIRDNTLVYDYQEGNLFNGGSEYRPLDLRDVRFKGAAVKFWLLSDTGYTAKLYTDDDRSYTAYSFITDQDGQFTITNRQGSDASTDADYIHVDFTFHPTYRDQNTDIYVFGALSNWQTEPRFKMEYDSRDGDYKCSALVKQGFYDYQYAAVGADGTIDLNLLEGNHWETENNYTILVYYRSPNGLGDELVGISRLNTALK